MYDHDLNEVMDFYASVFSDFKLIHSMNGPEGNGMVATFEIKGQQVYCYNGGPHFKFSDAASLFIDCETQEDVDYLWEKLSEGGAKSECGWLIDKFGVRWQVIPSILMELQKDPNPAKAHAVVQAMLKMSKIVIADLEAAYASVE